MTAGFYSDPPNGYGFWFQLSTPCWGKEHSSRCNHAQLTVGPFRTKAVAVKARQIYLKHRYRRGYHGISKMSPGIRPIGLPRMPPPPFKTLAQVRRKFNPVRYCYGHPGERHDRSATHCGCGGRLPSPARRKAREDRRKAELKRLRARIARLEAP